MFSISDDEQHPASFWRFCDCRDAYVTFTYLLTYLLTYLVYLLISGRGSATNSAGRLIRSANPLAGGYGAHCRFPKINPPDRPFGSTAYEPPFVKVWLRAWPAGPRSHKNDRLQIFGWLRVIYVHNHEKIKDRIRELV